MSLFKSFWTMKTALFCKFATFGAVRRGFRRVIFGTDPQGRGLSGNIFLCFQQNYKCSPTADNSYPFSSVRPPQRPSKCPSAPYGMCKMMTCLRRAGIYPRRPGQSISIVRSNIPCSTHDGVGGNVFPPYEWGVDKRSGRSERPPCTIFIIISSPASRG